MSGPVAKAARFCAVFCTPSARPDQARPASSAVAVKPSPLSATETTDADGQRQRAPARPACTATPTQHHRAAPTAARAGASGAAGCPRRSDQRPAPRRPSAPSQRDDGQHPAGVAAVPAATRDEVLGGEVAVANCGTTSSELAACTRHSVGRCGTATPAVAPGGSAAARAGAGSRASSPIRSATTRQASAGTARAAPTPWRWASGGITSAAAATPSGWPICRTPMATPRWCAPNQPITSRPLAALTEAPAAPMRANTTAPGCRFACRGGSRARLPPVSRRPMASTARSPNRSARAPQRIRVRTSPTDGRGGQRAGLGERQAVGPAQPREQEREPEHQRGRLRSGRPCPARASASAGCRPPLDARHLVRTTRPASRRTTRSRGPAAQRSARWP